MLNKNVKYLPITSLLTDIIDNRGKSVPTVDKGFPLIATNCIKESSIYPTFDKVRFVDDNTLKTWFRAHLKPNDILFVNKGTPGRVCLVPDPVTFCAAQDMMGFRCNDNLVSYKYLFAVLRSTEIQKTIQNNHVGLVIPHFRKQDLSSILIPVIDRNEQNLIGDIYITISEKIELNNRINAELEAMAKTLYDYWFVQFDFPVYNSDGTLGGAEGYKSSGGKMVWNEELKREVPEGWTKGTLLDLGDIIGGSTPPREVQEYFTNNGTAWITPKDLSLNTGNKFISKGELDVSENGIKAASLNIMPKGTILLSSRAPIGYLAISREKVTTNQGFKSFVPNKGFSKEYVYYSVKNMIPTIENNAAGSTFKEVSATTLKSISICLADKAIVSKYTETVSSIFNRQDILEKENQQLSTLRDWLLPMLMNGQVSVGATLGAKEYKLSSDEVMVAAEPEVESIDLKDCSGTDNAILAGYIIYKNRNKEFGRVKLMKQLYLVEQLCDLNLHSNFYRNTAGPCDENLVSNAESVLIRYQCYKVEQQRTRNGHTLVCYKEQTSASNIPQMFEQMFDSKKDLIDNLINKLSKLTSDMNEIIATLFAVWNNRLLSKKTISEGDLLNDFYDWSSHKKDFTKEQVLLGLEFMKNEKLIPQRKGKYIDIKNN